MLLVNAAICNPENPEDGWMDGQTLVMSATEVLK